MKNALILTGAICAIVLTSASFGGMAVYTYARVNGLSEGQAQIVQGANSELKRINEEITQLKTAIAAKPANGKKG